MENKGSAQDMPTVEIAGIEWTTENVKITKLRDGTDIRQVKNKTDWKNAFSNRQAVWCYLDFDESNQKYGVIYNRYAIEKLIQSPPKGYRVPTLSDWQTMIQSVKTNDKDLTAGIRLKSAEDWVIDQAYEKIERNGDNASGFNAKPGGYINSLGVHQKADEGVSFWLGGGSQLKGVTLARYYSHYQLKEAKKMAGMYLRMVKTTPSEELAFDALIIEGQLWMPANVDYAHYQNGDPIPYAKTEKEWDQYCADGVGAYRYQFFDESVGKPYGKLYNIFAVNDQRGLLPSGWRLPDKIEFDVAVRDPEFRKTYVNGGVIPDRVNKRGKIKELGGDLDCWSQCEESEKYPYCHHSVRNGSNGSTSYKTTACGVRGIKK